MKKLYLTLLLLCFIVAISNAQTLYGADAYGIKTKPVGFVENDKIYGADGYGLKDKVIGFIERGKEYDMLYSADKYQLKNAPVAFIKSGQLLKIYSMKARVCAFFGNGKVYTADEFGLKDRIIGFYSGGDIDGAACAAIILILK